MVIQEQMLMAEAQMVEIHQPKVAALVTAEVVEEVQLPQLVAMVLAAVEVALEVLVKALIKQTTPQMVWLAMVESDFTVLAAAVVEEFQQQP
jgi:hypothetical protein